MSHAGPHRVRIYSQKEYSGGGLLHCWVPAQPWCGFFSHHMPTLWTPKLLYSVCPGPPCPHCCPTWSLKGQFPFETCVASCWCPRINHSSSVPNFFKVHALPSSFLNLPRSRSLFPSERRSLTTSSFYLLLYHFGVVDASFVHLSTCPICG